MNTEKFKLSDENESSLDSIKKLADDLRESTKLMKVSESASCENEENDKESDTNVELMCLKGDGTRKPTRQEKIVAPMQKEFLKYRRYTMSVRSMLNKQQVKETT